MRMKENTWIGVALAVVLAASCTAERSEVMGPVEGGSRGAEASAGRIGFRVQMEGMTTKAQATTTGNLESFRVTALKVEDGSAVSENYFTDMRVEMSGGVGTTDLAVYWPNEEGSALDFYAYAPDTLAGVTVNSSEKRVEGFVLSDGVKDQKDVVVGYALGESRTGNESAVATPVTLRFRHVLSQIDVRAKSSSLLDVRVLGAKVCRIRSGGSFTFSVPEGGEQLSFAWTPGGAEKGYYCGVNKPEGGNVTQNEVTLPKGPDAAAVSILSETGAESFMLVPQGIEAWNTESAKTSGTDNGGVYIGVLCRIFNYAGQRLGQQLYPYTEGLYGFWAIPIGAGANEVEAWEAGKRYVYTVTFNGARGYADPDPTVPGPERPDVEPYVDAEHNGDMFPGTAEVTVDVTVEDWGEATEIPLTIQ